MPREYLLDDISTLYELNDLDYNELIDSNEELSDIIDPGSNELSDSGEDISVIGGLTTPVRDIRLRYGETVNNLLFAIGDDFGVTEEGVLYARESYIRNCTFQNLLCKQLVVDKDAIISGDLTVDGELVVKGKIKCKRIKTGTIDCGSIYSDGDINAKHLSCDTIACDDEIRIDGITITGTSIAGISYVNIKQKDDFVINPGGGDSGGGDDFTIL